MTNKNKKSFHPDKVLKYKELEEKLNDFFEYNRKLGNAFMYKTLITEMIKIDENNIGDNVKY